MEQIRPLSKIIQDPINPAVVPSPRWDSWGGRVASARKNGIRTGNSRGAVGAGNRSYVFDINNLLSDGAQPITANGWGQANGQNAIVDLGGNQGVVITLPPPNVAGTYTPQQPRIDAAVWIEINQIAVSSNVYRMILIGSNNAGFTSGAGTQWLGCLEFGTGASMDGYSIAAGGPTFTGTTQVSSSTFPGSVYELMFTNEQNNVKYQYFGLYVTVSGSAPSIQFKAFIAVLPSVC